MRTKNSNYNFKMSNDKKGINFLTRYDQNRQTLIQNKFTQTFALTCFRDILQLYLISQPSLSKVGCSLSFTMKIISAGIEFGFWSPSSLKVILVPAFQPGFTLIVRIFISRRVDRISKFRTFLSIFILLVQPIKTSSKETYKSW